MRPLGGHLERSGFGFGGSRQVEFLPLRDRWGLALRREDYGRVASGRVCARPGAGVLPSFSD